MTTLLFDESGATSVEYGLVAALVAIAGIVAITTMGDTIASLFFDVADTVEATAGE